jgi:hypothetical protein
MGGMFVNKNKLLLYSLFVLAAQLVDFRVVAVVVVVIKEVYY